MSTPTRVICVRGIDPRQDPDFRYVGRAVPRARWTGSIWGNPFMVGMRWDKAAEFLVAKNREHMWTGYVNKLVEQLCTAPDLRLTGREAITCFAVYLDNHPVLTERLPDLRGRKLGCWCLNFNGERRVPTVACHAVVLALKADGRLKGPDGLEGYFDKLRCADPIPFPLGARPCLTT